MESQEAASSNLNVRPHEENRTITPTHLNQMNSQIHSLMSQSAIDFQNIVWPSISKAPLVNGGKIIQVEAVADKDFQDQLDLLAGIDAWQVQYAPTAMRGIASRVQWGECRKSFTIRIKTRFGNETEFQKRLRAIENIDNGHLYPHLTIQAYLDNHNGKLLGAAAIKTIDLIRAANMLVENRAKLSYRPDYYGFIQNKDDSEFLYMRWGYLTYKGRLNQQDVV